VRKDLEAGFDEVICVCVTEKIKNEILFKLKETEPETGSEVSILDTNSVEYI